MFLSATLTYGLGIILIGYWFWHVWRKAMNARTDPAEAALVKLKNKTGVAKKHCDCAEQPCDCVSNSQAKRAAKLAKAAAAASAPAPTPVLRKPIKKTKNHESPAADLGSKPVSGVAAAPTTPVAHSGKKSQSNSSQKKPFNVIELQHDDSSSDDDAHIARRLDRKKLPEKWQNALKSQASQWNALTEAEQQEVNITLKKLSNTYNKLRTQRRKLRPLVEMKSTRGRNDTNKFAVFDESGSTRPDQREDDTDEEEELAKLILDSAEYLSNEKMELMKVLIDDLEHELYRLGDQKPKGAVTAPAGSMMTRRKTAAAAAARKRVTPSAYQRSDPQDYIPGLPANMMT